MNHKVAEEKCRACGRLLNNRHYVKAGDDFFHPVCFQQWRQLYELRPITHEWRER